MSPSKKTPTAKTAAAPSPPPLWERYRTPLLLFGAGLLVFCVFSGNRLLHQSIYAHFIYQADAFLHGQLAMRFPAAEQRGLGVLQRPVVRAAFRPSPPCCMMPFVALMGLQFNDVFFTVVCAALNVALFYLCWSASPGAGDSPRTLKENVALALLFAFGTVNFYISIRGQVWFTAEVVGVTMTCLYLLAAHRARHPAWAGLLFGCATITRTPLMFAGLFFLFELLMPEGRWDAAALKARMPEVKKKLVASSRFRWPRWEFPWR